MAAPVVTPDELAPLRGERILVTGAAGMLGSSFVEALSALPDVYVSALTHEELDVTNAHAVAACAAQKPTIILHCGALALADECERNPELARAVHVGGTAHVAELALGTGARVFYPQSVFIFDGSELPVTERTRPAPDFVYGRVKLEAEHLLLDRVPHALVVRMAGFFGGDARDKNFVGKFVRELAARPRNARSRIEVGDRRWQPTYTLDLARNTLLLLAHGKSGIYHMGAIGDAAFFEVAQVCVDSLGLGHEVEIVPASAAPFTAAEPAKRPSRMVTSSERLIAEGLMRQRPWDVALREYLARPYFDAVRHAA